MANEGEGQKPRTRRRIPDAGKRVVLAGVEVPFSALPEEAREQLDRVKATAPKEGERRGTVVAYIALDTVDADTKKGAIDKVAVDGDGEEVPGLYRAPHASAWRGATRLKAPEKVPLERETLD